MAISTGRLSEEIGSADYRNATDTFCRLVMANRGSFRTVVRTVVGAAAPYIQLPTHIATRAKTGEPSLAIPYDHTILGWRAALALGERLQRTEVRFLPAVQAMWYVPQGLDILGQTQCEFPGAYAKIFQCGSREPEADPNKFDGESWRDPTVYFGDLSPITSGSAEQRFSDFTAAIADGEREESYELFLGLAHDEALRDRLSSEILKAGIRDLQETMINHNGKQNLGHKALRARALVDISNRLGWRYAHDVFYSVVPDIGCAPRLYDLWSTIGQTVKAELPAAKDIPKRTRALTTRELDALADALLWGGPVDVSTNLIQLFRAGYGLLDVADAVFVGFLGYVNERIEHPSGFNVPTHAMDYANVVNTWIRDYDDPDQIRGPFMVAHFMNDVVRYNASFPSDPAFALEPSSTYRSYAARLSERDLPTQIRSAVVAQDCARAAALIDSYLDRTRSRRVLIASLSSAALHFQNDPHILRNCCTMIDEYEHNQTPRRDDFLRVFGRFQARYGKRTLEEDAFMMHERHFGKGIRR